MIESNRPTLRAHSSLPHKRTIHVFMYPSGSIVVLIPIHSQHPNESVTPYSLVIGFLKGLYELEKLLVEYLKALFHVHVALYASKTRFRRSKTVCSVAVSVSRPIVVIRIYGYIHTSIHLFLSLPERLKISAKRKLIILKWYTLVDCSDLDIDLL